MKTVLFGERSTIARLILALTGIGVLYLAYRGATGGPDFGVYHQTARHWLEGEPIYSVARDGAWTYKYPPWTLPAFLPFTLFDATSARFAWMLLSLGCIFGILRELRRDPLLGVRIDTFGIAFIGTFGVWLSHFALGQVILPVTFLCLHLWRPRLLEESSARGVTVAWLLSFKIFPVFALLLDFRPVLRTFRTIVTGLSIIALLVLAAAMAADLPEPGLIRSLESLMRGWLGTLTDGNALLGRSHVFGHKNQGLPALLLRVLEFSGRASHPQGFTVAVSLLLVPVAGIFLRRSLRRANPREVWAGALALVPVIHPLAWRHMYVFAFPLVCLAIERAREARDRRLLTGAVLASWMIGNITGESLGHAGRLLELASIKSLGVLLAILVLGKSLVPSRARGSLRT